MATPRPGDVIAGKYRVERLLGEGGMGIVLAARHLQLQHQVAIKLPCVAFELRADVAERLLREARATMQIRGEHVARVTDAGVHENGAPFFVMEYLDGQDLSSLVRQNGPLPAHTAVEYLLQAIEAVAGAHALGIIHRDLKPSNLFLLQGPDGSPLIKVIDFGLAKFRSSPSAALTETGATLGSMLFMAPEQMRGASDVDERADVWALGATLHTLLAGTPPFPGHTLLDVYDRIRIGAPNLTELRRDIPPELAAVCQRCLQIDKQSRYETVAHLADAVAVFGPPQAQLSAQRARRILANAPARYTVRPDVVSAAPSEVVSTSSATALPEDASWRASDGAPGGATTPPSPRLPRLQRWKLAATLATAFGASCLVMVFRERAPVSAGSSSATATPAILLQKGATAANAPTVSLRHEEQVVKPDSSNAPQSRPAPASSSSNRAQRIAWPSLSPTIGARREPQAPPAGTPLATTNADPLADPN